MIGYTLTGRLVHRVDVRWSATTYGRTTSRTVCGRTLDLYTADDAALAVTCPRCTATEETSR